MPYIAAIFEGKFAITVFKNLWCLLYAFLHMYVFYVYDMLWQPAIAVLTYTHRVNYICDLILEN